MDRVPEGDLRESRWRPKNLTSTGACTKRERAADERGQGSLRDGESRFMSVSSVARMIQGKDESVSEKMNIELFIIRGEDPDLASSDCTRQFSPRPRGRIHRRQRKLPPDFTRTDCPARKLIFSTCHLPNNRSLRWLYSCSEMRPLS